MTLVVVSDRSPLRLLVLAFAGVVGRDQARVITCLVEENRVLGQQLGDRPLRLTRSHATTLSSAIWGSHKTEEAVA